jgi:hypothetical protein
MTTSSAFLDGVRRVNRAPAILVSVWLTTALVSLPLTLTVRESIERQLGASLEGQKVAAGADLDWMDEFQSQTSGVATTLTAAVIGFAAVIDNSSALLDNERPALLVSAAVSVYLTCLTFLAGGILDRYARDRPIRAHGFFAACGVFFFRFLRLALPAAAVYGLLFGAVHPVLFGSLLSDVTRDFTSERSVFAVRLAFYALFALALAACNLVFDYAKVRAVVEDRRSMLGALAAALRFIGRNARGVASLYALDATCFAAVLALYAATAPGAGAAGIQMWVAFVVGQLYVLARLWVKLVFWASETALFQGRLGHAGYVARPQPAWPDSPAAEAIGPNHDGGPRYG